MAPKPAPAKSQRFAERGSKQEIETASLLQPKFDADGLIPAIVTDARSGQVLMFAWMNADALARTIESKLAHFWSRSRRALWKKGEESGNFLAVVEMRTDCDQDVVWMRARVAGDGLACHTGRESCFYRSIPLKSGKQDVVALVPVQRNRRKA